MVGWVGQQAPVLQSPQISAHLPPLRDPLASHLCTKNAPNGAQSHPQILPATAPWSRGATTPTLGEPFVGAESIGQGRRG